VVASTPTPARQSFRMANEHRGLSQLRGEFRAFNRMIENRLDRDLMVFARHKESLDTAKNERNLDRIVFSGVAIEKLQGTAAEKIPILKDSFFKIVAAILDINEGSEEPVPEIMFVSHLNPQIKSVYRVIEARFETKQIAAGIREAFSKKYKESRRTGTIADSLKGVGVNLSVTRETKVRIEVLKALAKIVDGNTDASCSAFVLQYMPRPMLKVVIRKGETQTYARTYGFTEAIEFVRASYPINDQDLFQAYSKAGNMKNLEHKFVVLKESRFAREIPDEDDYDGGRNKRPNKRKSN